MAIYTVRAVLHFEGGVNVVLSLPILAPDEAGALSRGLEKATAKGRRMADIAEAAGNPRRTFTVSVTLK